MQPAHSNAEKSILIVEANARSRKATARALAATGATTLITKNATEALATLGRGPIDVVVTDWENAEVIPHATLLNPLVGVVMLADRPVFERHGTDIMVLPMSSLMLTNFVARTEENDHMATRELVTTVAKLITNDIFGLEKYLNWGAAIHHHEVHASGEAKAVVEMMCSYAARTGMSERDRSSLALLGEELFMNAMWDAPVDAGGRPRYADRPRSTPIALEPNEYVTARFGSDGHVMAFSVADQFGRLERELAVRYIMRCFRRGDQGVEFDRGGSGLGLYMAFNSVSSFIINVAPARCTEVIGLIRLGKANLAAEALEMSRSLCYFRARPGEAGSPIGRKAVP